MFRTTAFIIVLTATAISGLISHGDSSNTKVVAGLIALTEVQMDSETGVGSDTESVPVELTADERAVVAWAVGRFAEAGLDLPDIEVRFDPTRDLCGNADGLYTGEPAGPHQVTICTRDSETFAAQLERRRTLLHEFGHVWDTVNLTHDDRDHLSEVLGASAWYDDDLAWADRGVERFAETFVFNLLDQPARQLKVAMDCNDLLVAFSDATGAAPLGPGLPVCA